MLKLGLLVSGGLGLDTLIKMEKEYSILFVLTDSRSEGVIECSKNKNIPCYAGNPRDGKAFEFIKDIEVDVICSVNYLFIINSDIITHSKRLTFNIHGSLLPKYRGRTPHVWAIINNETSAGITAHVIDEHCDTGHIIKQIKISIEAEDTGGVLLEKYKKAYFPLIKEVLNKLESATLEFTKQDDSLATYFHQRKPEDGKIDWNWQKERIKNWVRAQSFPYPGAFSYYIEDKVIIDKIEFSNLGFDASVLNGTILKSDSELIIKTPNGAVKILKKRGSQEFEVGEVLK